MRVTLLYLALSLLAHSASAEVPATDWKSERLKMTAQTNVGVDDH